MTFFEFGLEPTSEIIDIVDDRHFDVQYCLYLEPRQVARLRFIVVGVRTSLTSGTAPATGGAIGASSEDLDLNPGFGATHLSGLVTVVYGLVSPPTTGISWQRGTRHQTIRLGRLGRRILGFEEATGYFSFVTNEPSVCLAYSSPTFTKVMTMELRY